jgi:circadian clock protein KaiB
MSIRPVQKKMPLRPKPRTPKSPVFLLRLYVTGQTPRSTDSIRNLKEICDKYLTGQFELEVVDIYQQPERAQEAQIVAAPTLVKSLPPPLRKLIGDLSNRDDVLTGLGIVVRNDSENAEKA